MEGGKLFLDFASSLGVKVGNHNRIEQAVKLVGELSKSLHNSADKDAFLAKHNKHGECIYSLTELCEVRFIHDHLQKGHIDNALLAKKIGEVLTGGLTVWDETPQSNHARNTLFELRLCATLNERGMKAELHDPNPDILASTTENKYQIQCKRAWSNRK